ncbi:MAG: dTDP-4-dehydrorhamnose reductase [Bdellovibrionales bacterium GWB1_52_6]|nr:MAG: dTDP-4-dehydrorhamnose reductase [Bdellovibrionales bacterium GWB1_52_6]OFZ05241.1 MAG: dTDP-4-dehydrorhamnose reductase [Bdellovibrionales bacterium GWA1_52_35]HCM38626.1 dTDP-4-dehydrorhamnose reductase [Bdellovibrionales bacterium]
MTLSHLQLPGKIVVFGTSGQVGGSLLKLLGERGIGLDYPQVDLSKPESLAQHLDRLQPDAVINAAAYTQVDKAETEEKLAYLINAESPGAIARWCAEKKIPFIHYSTDYVFSGEGERAWNEEDEPHPLNKYGLSKLLGEQAIAKAGGQWLLFRTSWIYGATGVNFFKTMLKCGAEREDLRIVNDQYGSPTYAPELAEATLKGLHTALLQKSAGPGSTFPSGIYHLTGSGVTTWFDFANAIFEEARVFKIPLKIQKLVPITSAEYPTPARRPRNSRMNNEKARGVLGVSLPHWKTSLIECMLHFQ